MNQPLDNQHVIEIKPLPSPRIIKSKLPITDEAASLVVETREAIRRILHGQDHERLLVIVGPCSIHDPEAAYEYADRLKPVADALRDRLLIVMRTYFENRVPLWDGRASSTIRTWTAPATSEQVWSWPGQSC